MSDAERRQSPSIAATSPRLSASKPSTYEEMGGSENSAKVTRRPIKEQSTTSIQDTVEHYRQDESASVESNEYLSFAKSPLVSFGNSSAAAERLGSPDGEGYEVIDPNEEICDSLSSIVINDTDVKEDLVIPAVNDEHGVSRDFTVPPGTRYILPIMVATPGAILSWSFKTVYKVLRLIQLFRYSTQACAKRPKGIMGNVTEKSFILPLS